MGKSLVVIILSSMLVGFCLRGIVASVAASHKDPLCLNCASEYERGRCEGIMELQIALEKGGFATFEDGEWKPVRVVTIERLLKEDPRDE